MKKTGLLAEELSRHLQILNYADKVSSNVIEEKFKITFQEQEPPETDEPADTEIPDMELDAMTEPPAPEGDVAPEMDTPPTPPAPGEQELAPPPPPPVPADEEVEELDVTELVKKNEEIGDTVEKFSSQLVDIESKFSELNDKLETMDMIFQKINNLESEIQQMAPPTPVEKLELRSLDSYPYNQRLDDYFEQKKSQYKRLRGVDMEPEKEKEYTLTVGETEEWDDNTIQKSFNPDFDENN